MEGCTPSLLQPAPPCRHCLLVEMSAGLVPAGTGHGLREVRTPAAAWLDSSCG